MSTILHIHKNNHTIGDLINGLRMDGEHLRMLIDNDTTINQKAFIRKPLIYDRDHMIKVEEHILKVLKEKNISKIIVTNEVISIEKGCVIRYYTSHYNYSPSDWNDIRKATLQWAMIYQPKSVNR